MKVLVTGGDTGLGKAITERMKSAGHDVIVMKTDALKEAVWNNTLKMYIDDYIGNQKFDIIVNNFGVNHLSWIGETEENDQLIMIANTMTPYWVVNNQVKNGAVARVLNISSITHRVAQRTSSIYCASKAAVSQMTRVMARELAPNGWVVNALAPGKILDTDMTRMVEEQVVKIRGWTPEEALKYERNLIPMGRAMTVQETAQIAYDIIMMPSYVNGSVIEACGGV